MTSKGFRANKSQTGSPRKVYDHPLARKGARVNRRGFLKALSAIGAAFAIPIKAAATSVQPTVAAASVFVGRLWNVLDFGAKGDGETDDTEAFQAAMDEATRDAMLFGTGTVYVPRSDKPYRICPKEFTVASVERVRDE